MQRCSVKFCSRLGTHVLTSVEELAAANVGVEFKDKCKGSILCPIHLAQIPGRQRQAAVHALEAAAEERKVEAAAAAANLREKLAYDRGVRDGIWMATDRQNQGRRRQAVTATLFVIAVLYAGISFDYRFRRGNKNFIRDQVPAEATYNSVDDMPPEYIAQVNGTMGCFILNDENILLTLCAYTYIFAYTQV